MYTDCNLCAFTPAANMRQAFVLQEKIGSKEPISKMCSPKRALAERISAAAKNKKNPDNAVAAAAIAAAHDTAAAAVIAAAAKTVAAAAGK